MSRLEALIDRLVRRKQADLSPPLGYPGGSCHLQERIQNEVRSPDLARQLVEDHLSGKDKKPHTKAEHAIYDELPEGPVRGTSFRKVIFDEHAQYRMDQRGVTVPEVFEALRAFQKEWAKERSRGIETKTRLLQQPREFEFQHAGLVVVARPLTFFDPKSNPNPVLRIRTVFPLSGGSVGKPTDNCPTFTGWSREYPEHGLDRILPARVAQRYMEALRTPPVPGVKTLVTDKSEKGLPTDIDREKQVNLPPGSATPGGAGRVIPRFEYNTPDADTKITPRTMGLPGEQYGVPTKYDYNGLTMRTMTGAPDCADDGLDEETTCGCSAEDDEGMDKEAYKQRWRPGKRQRRSRGAERAKRRRQYRRNRPKRRQQSRRWRQRNKNKSSFRRSQKRRRTQNRRRRVASVTRVSQAFQNRMASVLTVPDIAFMIGPEEFLGYVHSISPMTGMVTIELDEPGAPPLDSLPVELFMRMAVFLTDEDIDAFYDLVDVEIGPEAYEDLDEDLVRDCARRYDKDPDSDEFKADCFAATGENSLDAMSADQLDVITQAIVGDFVEGGHARSLEDADNEDIDDVFSPALFYGEVDVER